jgi:hypothetical protein
VPPSIAVTRWNVLRIVPAQYRPFPSISDFSGCSVQHGCNTDSMMRSTNVHCRSARMAQRPAPAPQPAQLTTEEVRSAIPRLERRVSELKALDVDSLTEDSYVDILEDIRRRTDDTLVTVFGHDTVDYHRYSIGPLDPLIMFGDEPSILAITQRPGQSPRIAGWTFTQRSLGQPLSFTKTDITRPPSNTQSRLSMIWCGCAASWNSTE